MWDSPPIMLAMPRRVAVVLPALDGTPLQKCYFWHLLPQGAKTRLPCLCRLLTEAHARSPPGPSPGPTVNLPCPSRTGV